MSESNPDLSSFPRGTAKGFTVVGRKVLTVTATTVESDDGLISTLISPMTAGLSPAPGESLKEYAGRIAEALGLVVTQWEITGGDDANAGPETEEENGVA